MLVEPCLKSGQRKGLFGQKACLVKKSIWPISLFGWKVSSATSQFSLQPHSPNPTPSSVSGHPYLPFNIIQNCFIRRHSDSYYISFARRACHPPIMKISLLRHDLLGEERWLISPRRRSKSLFLNGLLLGSICIGIQVKLISHGQAVRIKQ